MEANGVLEKIATAPEEFHNSEIRGEPLVKILPQGLERPNPPTHASRYRGCSMEAIGAQSETATGPENFAHLVNRGEPLAKFWSPGTGGGGHIRPKSTV